MIARGAAFAAGLVLLLAAGTGLTAGNSVPASYVGQTTQPITANALKPAACAGLDLTTVVTSGSGTAGNDLVLGTAGDDSLHGGGGTDCVVAGSGTDTCYVDTGSVTVDCENVQPGP